MVLSGIQLPKNKNPKEEELRNEDKNFLAAFRIVYNGYRRAQERTRAVIKAYNDLEAVALTLLKEYDKNREESPKQNRAESTSPNINVDDELADVLLVDLTSDFDFDHAQRQDDTFRSPSPIFGIPSKKRRSSEDKNSSKLGESSKLTKLEVIKNQQTVVNNNKTIGNEENNKSLVNTSPKYFAGPRENESRSNLNDSRPNIKLSLAKSAYKIEKHKGSGGKTSKQSTLVLQPLATKVDISSTEKTKRKSDASRHWANLFDEDYRVKKDSISKASTSAEKEKVQPKVDKQSFIPNADNPVMKSVSKVVGDKKPIQEEQKPNRIIGKTDPHLIMETPSQIDETARSLFDDEDLDDFQISQDLLNTGIDEAQPPESLKLESPDIFEKSRPINEDVATTSKISQSYNGLDSIDETFFAPAEPQVVNNVVANPVKKASPLAGCSKVSTPKFVDKGRALKRKSDDNPLGKDELEDLNLVDSDWDTDISNDNWPPPKRPLNNSFDIVPEKATKSPAYAYKDKTERNKDKRSKLPGWDCWECEKYYGLLNLPPTQLRERMKACSRHKAKFNPRYYTPKDFWNPEFPDTCDSSDFSDNEQPVKKG